MKLSTATVHDTQTEWMERFAAAVEKDSGGRIKAEIYPASQLGTIPRQIEGVQFGTVQGWIGPPEFLVGIDERYEVLSAPGLFSGREQYQRTIDDPQVHDLILGLGANKGLLGAGIFPIGPSSIDTRKPVHRLTDYSGLKIRVLASQFQMELIKHGRLAGSDDACRRAARAATGHHRRHAHHRHAVHDAALYRRRLEACAQRGGQGGVHGGDAEQMTQPTAPARAGVKECPFALHNRGHTNISEYGFGRRVPVSRVSHEHC